MRIDFNIVILRHILWTNQPFLRSVDFLMVILASGIARGRVRTTTTTTAELPNMADILQK